MQRMGGINDMVITNDQQMVVSVGQDRKIVLWDNRHADAVYSVNIDEENDEAFAIAKYEQSRLSNAHIYSHCIGICHLLFCAFTYDLLQVLRREDVRHRRHRRDHKDVVTPRDHGHAAEPLRGASSRILPAQDVRGAGPLEGDPRAGVQPRRQANRVRRRGRRHIRLDSLQQR